VWESNEKWFMINVNHFTHPESYFSWSIENIMFRLTNILRRAKYSKKKYFQKIFYVKTNITFLRLNVKYKQMEYMRWIPA
jgi:hypothetical protein